MTTIQSRLSNALLTHDTNDPQFPIDRVMAEIVSVQPLTKSCTVFFGGSEKPVAGVKYLGTYWPVPEDIVWIDRRGPDCLIIGTHKNTEWVSYTSTTFGFINGSKGSVYHREGMTCDVNFNFAWGGSAGSGTVFEFTLPFPANPNMYRWTGAFNFLDSDTGAWKTGACTVSGGSDKAFFIGSVGIVSGNFGIGVQNDSNVSITIAGGDILEGQLRYSVSPGF